MFVLNNHTPIPNLYINDYSNDIVLIFVLVCWSTLSITYLWGLEGTFFQHIIGIPMGTKCAPLPTDLFLYSYEAEFMHKLIKGFTDTKYFNLTYRYINDVLFTNNPNLAIKIPLICPQRT